MADLVTTHKEKPGLAPADRLMVDDIENELGSDERNPRFSWCLAPGTTGSSCGSQIQVYASDGERERCVWDSGEVSGSQTHLVPYEGEAIQPFTRYRWRVRWVDQSGTWAPWSHSAWWETGPLTEADWADASWIAGRSEAHPFDEDPDPRACPEPLLRTRFDVPAPVRVARLYLAGLGYGIPWLNGRRVGDRLLDPAPTRYDRTVLYTSFDVTSELRSGVNVLGIELGRGRLGEPRPNVWRWDSAPWWDHPKAIALLRLVGNDGIVISVTTSTAWECSTGTVLRDSLFGGEWFDDRADPGEWSAPSAGAPPWARAVEAAPPGGILRAQRQPPIKVIDRIMPTSVAFPESGTRVFDFGRQLAGWVKTDVALQKGQRIDLRYGEKLGPRGTILNEQRFIEPPIQRDVVIGAGRPVCYEPRFAYKGFRYLQLEGLPDDHPATVTGILLHTAVADRGTLRFSDPLLNRIHDGCKRAVLDNLHGVPTDTPTFEKNGWTGDGHLSLGTSLLNFDMSRFYSKWLQDFADAQTDDGELPPVVPAATWGYSSSPRPIAPVPSWDVAYAEICWAMYWYLDDDRPIREHYEHLVRYLRYLVARYPDLLVTWGLGDWKPPGINGHMPEGAGVYETIYLKRWATLLSRFADILGKDRDAAEFREVSDGVDSVFFRTFFDESGDSFRGEIPTNYRQSINVLALAHGLVPPGVEHKVVERLVAEIRKRDRHLDTGVFGTKFLFPVLAEHGYAQLAFDVLTSEGYPSYRDWFVDGESNLRESWGADTRSLNHHFFSSVDQWLYEGVLGIRPTSPGYRSFEIDGELLPRLEWASGSVVCPFGSIHVRWNHDDDGWLLQVTVPPSTSATVTLPALGEDGIRKLRPGEHRLVGSFGHDRQDAN